MLFRAAASVASTARGGSPAGISSRPEFRTCAVEHSSRTPDDILNACNAQMFSGYGPHLRADVNRPVAYPMSAYVKLLEAFASMPYIEVVTLRDLCSEPEGKDRVRLAIRHDVDGDITAALMMAEIEHRLDMPTSYYMLHTAPYHGAYRDGAVHRHVAVAEIYRSIQSLGHEIGLHTDALTVYQQHHMDGAIAIVRELNWMRREGLDVRGTVAHGSKSVFGSENYEIFRGRWKGRPLDPSRIDEPPDRIEFNGAANWLRVLNESSLGLEYEGNDVFRQDAVRVEYGATRTVDGWRWNRYRDRIKGAHPAMPEFCPQEVMLRDIEELEPGCCVVLTVHPCYYGLRHAPDRPPTMRLHRPQIVVNHDLGWETWRPNATLPWTGGASGQTVNAANELGVIDIPQPFSRERREAMNRILLLGSGHLDGVETAVPSHFHRVLDRMIFETVNSSAACAKLAFRDTGISRLWPWLEFGLRRFSPTLVVLGITTQAFRHSLPGIWTIETGFSPHHPPGAYLDVEDDQVVVRPRSSRWAIHRRTPRELSHWPGTQVRMEDAMGVEHALKVGPVDARDVLAKYFRHATDAIRRAGAKCMLMVCESGASTGWPPPWETDESNRQSIFRELVGRIARDCDVPCFDPYGAFRQHEPMDAILASDGSWMPEAHVVCAKAMYEMMVSEHLLR